MSSLSAKFSGLPRPASWRPRRMGHGARDPVPDSAATESWVELHMPWSIAEQMHSNPPYGGYEHTTAPAQRS